MKATKLYLLCFALALCANGANAQQYKWKDARGHTVYGDIPPPGVKATPLQGTPVPAAPPATAASTPSGDAAAKGAAKSSKPLTPSEQEMQFRQRVKEAQEAAAKKAHADKADRDRQENCQLAREQERVLASGQRIARVDSKGERYYIDDAQRTEELNKARSSVSQWCK